MNRMNWIVGSMLALLLVSGLALDVNAQQPATPASPAQTETKPAAPTDSSTPAASQPAPQPGAQSSPAQVPPSNVTIESKTERVERVVEQPARFLGMDPTLAMVLGAVLLIVIVIGLVAMSRRTDEVHHTHRV